MVFLGSSAWASDLVWVSYSWWPFAASFALFVISHWEPVNAAAVLLLALCQCLEQIGAFETHFADALVETGDAEAFGVIVFVDRDQAALERDALLFVAGIH